MPRYTGLFARTVRMTIFLVAAACADDGGANLEADGGLGAGDSGGEGDGGGESDSGVSAPDVTSPTIVSTLPRDEATRVSTATEVTATFDEAMATSTLTSSTFSLAQGAATVPGAVTYFNRTATFKPTGELTLGETYTATLTTAAKDLAGNALQETHTWAFTIDTTARLGPAPVSLGAAAAFAVLAKSAVTNVPTSVVTGDIGLSPAAASYITGFSLTRAGTKWTSSQVVGNVYAANNDPPTPTDLTTAIGNMETAYTDAAGRPTPAALNLGAGTIGGMTLTPGLYKWTSTVTIPTDLTISGAPNDTWIFQISGDLKMSAAKRMTLSGGAQAKNIVWQVAGLVELGTTSHAEGIILSKTAIKLGTGASVNGRLLAQTAVTIAGAAVTEP